MKKIEKRNNFREYGFTADFKGEITFIDHKNFMIGFTSHNIGIIARMWDINGKCYSIDGEYYEPKFNLVSIKWYEKEENYPCLMFNMRGKHLFVLNSKEDWDSAFESASNYRLATKDEIESLIVEEK